MKNLRSDTAPINREPVTLNCLTQLAIPSHPSMMFRHFFKAPKLEELVLYETDPYDAYELSKMIPGHVGPLPPFAGLKKLIFRDQRLHCPEIPAALISHRATHPIKHTKSPTAKPNYYHTCRPLVYFRTVDMLYPTDRSRCLDLAA